MPPTTVILLDFFGTLVDYSPSRTEQGYRRTHALLADRGVRLSYEGFLALWVRVSEEHDRLSGIDDREYSMTDVAQAFLRAAGAPGSAQDPDAVARLVAAYLAEWTSAVRPVEGLAGLLDTLRQRYRLAVVTNTHEPSLVPGLLRDAGVLDRFEAVVTSVEVGRRKPHPAIYAAALDALGVTAGQCLFVGDTPDADHDGPLRAGMAALLIDPAARHDVPPEHRIGSVLELPSRLAAAGRRTP